MDIVLINQYKQWLNDIELHEDKIIEDFVHLTKQKQDIKRWIKELETEQ